MTITSYQQFLQTARIILSFNDGTCSLDPRPLRRLTYLSFNDDIHSMSPTTFLTYLSFNDDIHSTSPTTFLTYLSFNDNNHSTSPTTF